MQKITTQDRKEEEKWVCLHFLELNCSTTRYQLHTGLKETIHKERVRESQRQGTRERDLVFLLILQLSQPPHRHTVVMKPV